MVKSMTGYGRGSASEELKSFDVEIKTVNSKYFDINIRMPRILYSLEDRIRKMINSKVSRGKTDVFITYRNLSEDSQKIVVNEALVGKLSDTLRKTADKYNLNGGVTLDLIASMEGIISLEEEKSDSDDLFSILSKALGDALAMLEEMRITEGRNLYQDILSKKDAIEERLSSIETLAPRMVPIYREKLTERLKELNEKFADDERIAMETAVFSDRASIDEEITRLKSHLKQLPEILKNEGPKGKKLDFLLQEMNRETNTMSSKSQDIEITGIVLEIKNENEKIREQIQNIE